jgi:YD repeat-containing protein
MTDHEVVLIEGGGTIFTGSAFFSTRGCTNPEMYNNTYVKIEHFKPSLIPLIEPYSNQFNYMYGLAALGLLGGSNFNSALYNEHIEDVRYIQMQYDDPQEIWVSNITHSAGDGLVLFRVFGGCGPYSPSTGVTALSAINLTYKDYKPLSHYSKGAGLRVKSITNYDELNSVASIKKFDYEGGKLMSPLLYFNNTTVRHQRQRVFNVNCNNSNDTAIVTSQVSSLNAYLNTAWGRFLENPTSQHYSIIQNLISQIQNAINQSTSYCTINSEIQWFMGLKKELYSGNFIQPSISAAGRYVGYDKVTEIIENKNSTELNQHSDNGVISDTYTNNAASGVGTLLGSGYFTSINLPLTQQFPENGLLIKREIRDNLNQLKSQLENTYSHFSEDCFWGFKTISTDTYTELIPLSNGLMQTENKYLTGVYPIKSGITKLKSSHKKNYFVNSEINELSEYFYDNYNQLNKVKTTFSNQDIQEVNFTYPYNHIEIYPFNEMINDNYLTPIVQKETKLNDQRIFLEQFDYDYWQVGFTWSFPLKGYHFAKGSTDDLEEIITYHKYDNNHNLKEVSKKDGTHIYYIWGYNGQFPIAKIENFKSPQTSGIETLIGEAISASNSDANYQNEWHENNLRLKLNNIRNHNQFKEALVTTYTYDIIKGVTSITNPRGYTVYYDYDDFHRLKNIKDQDGNILNNYEYNYANQN